MTIEEFLQEIIRVFKKVGIENAEGEARILACHVLSCDDAYLFVHQNEEIDDKVLLASAALINDRTKGRPIQYVIGKAEFYGLDIAVDERVLIPRPETELLVDLGLRTIKEDAAFSSEHENGFGLRILDLCCGSGCIAAALANNLPKAEIVACDLSAKAFMLARNNLRCFENVTVKRGDLFEAVDGTFDYIFTNPPYIPAGEIAGLQKEVKDYEPVMALNGGNDGMEIIQRIIESAGDYLRSGGRIFMETGHDQGEKCLEIAKKTGNFQNLTVSKDLEGHDRIFVAEKVKKA